jgi:uncharacterized membrane protein
MTPLVLACVVCAAILHAGWNAVLRGGGDRLWSMTLMMIAVTCVTAVMQMFVPWPNAASWPYVIASAVIHTGYNLSLVRTYRTGDLGQTYPVSRGSSPVLVALGAAIFAHESLDVLSCIGIALVCGGILSLAFQGKKVRADFLPAAFTTGVLIGAYTVPAVEHHDARDLFCDEWEAAGLHTSTNGDGAERWPRLDPRLRHCHLGDAV